MDKLLEDARVEPEDRPRAIRIIAVMKRVIECREFSIVNVAEGRDYLLKFYQSSAATISSRDSLSTLAVECDGVREASVHFAGSEIDAPLEIHVRVAKTTRDGIDQHPSISIEKIYLDERLREKAGDLHMPRALNNALTGVAAEVITNSKAVLDLRLTYSSGDNACVATFVGMRECSLSFLEHLFERFGRRLVDVDFRSIGLERQLVAHLSTEAELSPFPMRKKEKRVTDDYSNKRSRTDRR